MKHLSSENALKPDIDPKKYNLIEQIGEGGYGIVYKAEQISTGQIVAIKMLKFKAYSDEKNRKLQVARFERETQLCAQINHPHIVKLLDKGYTASQEPYAVFEYISGTTLKDVIHQHNGLSAEKTGALMEQVLYALVHAHDNGILHRDLKPHNIMVTQTQTKPYIKILDFGMGAFTNDYKTKNYQDLTLTQDIIGTPAYSSPEQLRGEAPTIKSDLYAWGLIFLECLTGQPVMQGTNIAEIFQQQLNLVDIPIPIPLIDHPIAKVLRSVLDKDPDRRVKSASELFQEYNKVNFKTIVGKIKPTHHNSFPISDDATQVNQFAWRSTHSEKRQITVLCAKLNIAVSEETPSLDIETLETTQSSQLVLCKDIGIKYGAYIPPIVADTVVMYFGYPKLNDNDARRAGRTALELIGQTQTRNQELYEKYNLKIDLRIAINSGTALIKQNSAPEGLITNTAFNLLHSIQPWHIIVSQTTKELLDPYLEFEKLDMATSSSIGNTIDTYLLIGERSTEALSNLSPKSANQKMIGRGVEKQQILDIWNSNKDNKTILVQGQAGIGKSKLIYEIKKEVITSGYHVCECRCLSEHQNNALYPIFEILKKDIDSLHDGSQVSRLEKVFQKADCDLQKSVPILCSWLSIPLEGTYKITTITPSEQKEVLFETLKKYLLSIESAKKFMLVIEDLHWIDPTSLEFFSQLIEASDQKKYTIVATARPNFKPEWNAKQFALISLETLNTSYTKTLIADILKHEQISDEVTAYIMNRADGIPLFIESLTQMLLEQKDIYLQDNIYVLKQNLDDESIPITLKGLLNSRISKVGHAKETAQVAAAIGREFTHKMLLTASPYDDNTIQSHIHTLIEANLIYKQRRIENEIYVFRHALIRDAAYESMTSSLCREVHANIAETIKSNFPEIVNERPIELANHLAEAQKYETATQFGIQAVQKHIKNSANEEALKLYALIKKWIDGVENNSNKIESELILNDLVLPAQMAIGGYGCKEVIQINKRNEELINIAYLDENNISNKVLTEITHRIEWGLFLNYHFHSKRKKAAEIANSILSKLKKYPNRDIEVGVLPLIAQAFHADGELEKAEKLCLRVFDIYNAQTDVAIGFDYNMEPKSSSYFFLSSIYLFKGEVQKAEKYAVEGIKWSEEINHPVSITLAYLFYALYAYFLDDKELVRNIVEKHNLLHNDESGKNWVTTHLKMIGEWSYENINYAEEYVESTISNLQYYALSWYEPSLAQTYLIKNKFEKAIELLENSLKRSIEDNEFWTLSLVKRVLAESYYAKYKTLNKKIELLLKEAIKDAQKINATWFQLEALVFYSEIILKEKKKIPEKTKKELKTLSNKIIEITNTKLKMRVDKILRM
ncbi:TOMM system kinase/cyclase fusion protein [Aquimarina algicola]|uniref:TOMM system kinase/cyclase fusion protein n=1 Tax=Aquimarina algicola TaxID=2589995 RepID=UPI001CF310F2|nr:TOMM system kinase/cyclase fusion protein [Aquimarina algicola]